MPHTHRIDIAKDMLEHCRFAYKAYAQTLLSPMDPFFEGWGAGYKFTTSARDRMMEHTHNELKTKAGEDREMDPILYCLESTPNPHNGVLYRGDTDHKHYITFLPRDLDKKIEHATSFDINGKQLESLDLKNAKDNWRCAYFQGKTGMTVNHPSRGWRSFLGQVIYDPGSKTVVIGFRGSRSGCGSRALSQAQLSSKGNPDWVTDMNHLKGVKVSKYNNVYMAAGFHYAYESCFTSLEKAFLHAIGKDKPEYVFVTGHSLGGAMAQMAYIDIKCGKARANWGSQLQNANIQCFPLSAPPVCHGLEAQHWLSLNADATSIYHYYCPYDAVHASPLVNSSAFTKANWLVGTFTHPNTDPLHLGSEIALNNNEHFPDAHEPNEVYKSLHSNTEDPEFWPVVTLEGDLKTTPYLKDADGTKTTITDTLRTAIYASNSPEVAELIATDWSNVAKDATRRKTCDTYIKQLHDLNAKTPFDEANTLKSSQKTELKESLINLYKGSLGEYTDPSKHSASSTSLLTVSINCAMNYITID